MIDSDEDSILTKKHIELKESEKSIQQSLRNSPTTSVRKKFKVRRLN